MGILKPSKGPEKETPTPAKRKSIQPDLANIGPLKPGGAAGFMNFRDGKATKVSKKSKKGSESDMESDEDEETGSAIFLLMM
jgi:hypothetical protein